jgi:hypothetical protein
MDIVVPTAWIRPNGSDSDAYRDLLELDRAGWAWEWLRRNPAYVGETALAVPTAPWIIRRDAPFLRGRPWGLCFPGIAGEPRDDRASAMG